MVPAKENTMDAKYFCEGDKVKGMYYLTAYTGTITNRRCHGMNPNKMVYTITFGAPTGHLRKYL